MFIRYSYNQTDWSDWIAVDTAYRYSSEIYTARDGRLMLVTYSMDDLVETRFTSNGTDWKHFDSLTPAALLTNSPDFSMTVMEYLVM